MIMIVTGCCTRVAATPTHGLQIVFRHFSCTKKLHTGNKIVCKHFEIINRIMYFKLDFKLSHAPGICTLKFIKSLGAPQGPNFQVAALRACLTSSFTPFGCSGRDIFFFLFYLLFNIFVVVRIQFFLEFFSRMFFRLDFVFFFFQILFSFLLYI